MTPDKTLVGTLYNDPHLQSKHNWLFTEAETKEKYLVDESETEELNALVLEIPIFYALSFCAEKIGDSKKVKIFLGTPNESVKVIVNLFLAVTTSTVPHSNDKFPVWFKENSRPEFIDRSQVIFVKPYNQNNFGDK